MSTKQVKGVIVPRHDTALNWSKAINFIPKKGELIVYDADVEGDTYDTSVSIGTTECSIKSSDKVRFKFGDGTSNVNVLPFATTENSGGGEGGFTEEEIIEIIKEYSDIEAAAIVYLNTKQCIGEHVELQDVYPIQAEDTELKIVSKNRITYDFEEKEITGITLSTNSKKYLTVSGTAAVDLDGVTQTISTTTVKNIPGKYILKVDNNGIDKDNEKCYLRYYLKNADDEYVRESTKLTTEAVIIDTEELNCTDICIEAYIKINNGETLQTQDFQIQLNYGDEVPEYTHPVSIESYANREINVYDRNLFDATHTNNNHFKTVLTDTSISINGMKFRSLGNHLGTHYFKGIMNEDNFINYVEGTTERRLYTPLLEGDKFTLIYTITNITGNEATIDNVQIVYGHTDYERYTPFIKDTIKSDINGNYDISKLRHPYSFLSLSVTSEEDKRFAIYIQYDPALSRNWTEEQLEKIDNRLNEVEEITTPPIKLDVPLVADYVVDEEAYLYASGLVNTRDLHWQERLRITQSGNLVQGETWDADKIIKVKQTAINTTGINNGFFLTKTIDNTKTVGDTVKAKAFVWNKPSNPDMPKNILVVGDSYTARGTWLKHMTTDHMGDLSNYKFIGRNTTGGVKHEATNGYAWNNYLCDPNTLPKNYQDNPFWDTDTSAVNIKKYVDTYGVKNANLDENDNYILDESDTYTVAHLDYVICLLGYNARVNNAFWTDKYSKDESAAIESVRKYATEFINIVHTAYPNCKILLAGYALPPFLEQVNNTKWMEMHSRADFVHLINETYKELATAYPDYVRFAHTTSGIDATNGYTVDETTINHMTYKTIPDDLHLNDLGQHQLAEVMWRGFVALTNIN